MGNTGDRRGGRVWARNVAYTVRRDPVCRLAYPGICTGKSETADHIKSYADGGKDTPDNLQGACKACNWHRGNKDLPEHLTGAQESRSNELPGVDLEGSLNILFDGAEKPSHRVLLQSTGVTKFAFSYWRLRQRGLPKTKPYLLSEYFAPEAEIFVDSGWLQAQQKLKPEELEAYAAEYDKFLTDNLDRIDGATEMHFNTVGMPWINQWREKWGEHIGDLIYPVWLPEHGQPMLFTMAERYGNISLPHSALTDAVMPPRIGALHRQTQVSFHAMNVADPDKLRSMPLETASTMSWVSPQMRGETIVWDGTRLVRYQADRKTQARSRYKAVIEKAGLNYESVLADDAKEVTKLAIWSYLQLEKSMGTNAPFVPQSGDISVTERAKELSEGFEEPSTDLVPRRGDEGRHDNLATVAQREPSERRLLPVFGVETRTEMEMVDNVPTLVERRYVSNNSGSMRQCNTCVIAASCPAFQKDADCAYDLPLEVKTKDQRKALMDSLLELQGQRVAFAHFAEERNGGYPDPNMSQELDRMVKMLKTSRDLESNQDFVRVTMEQRSQNGGVLSSIFGEKRTQALHQDAPAQDADVIIKQVMGDQ